MSPMKLDRRPPAALRPHIVRALHGVVAVLALEASGPTAEIPVATLAELRTALGQATPGDLVRVADAAEITLDDAPLLVPEKVTLAGAGATITAAPAGERAAISLRPGARLTGLRLKGPNPPYRDLDARPFEPSGYAVACTDAEVDHCEILCFQRGGVVLFRDSVTSHIHHNHLHDIAAYPVLIARGSGDGHVIEHNRIEWAWHAIASNGSRGSGYTARFNQFVRVPRPKLFESSGPSPPNWCLDVHANDGAETTPPRPATRTLVVYDNDFLAAPGVTVGDGRDLLTANGMYPKHDIYVGPCPGVTTTVAIRDNRFLMHEKTGSTDRLKPFGRAIRIVGLRGHPGLEDDPSPAQGELRVRIEGNTYGTTTERPEADRPSPRTAQ